MCSCRPSCSPPERTLTVGNVEEIALGLTRAQRNAVLGRRRLDSGGGMWPLRNSLHRLGLTEGLADTPTPLWHAVRQHLLSSKEGE